MSSNQPNAPVRDALPVNHGPYPEFTWPAILVGWAIGVVIAASLSYAALKLGFSIEGSELAAILGWGVLRGVMRRTSILENNINQTIASAVNGASSGIMFSVPALFILSHKPGLESVANFNAPLMVFACIAGSFIGLAFVIPLRKQMIDFQRLPYPGGIAVATILKSPGAGIRKSVYLFGAALVSALFHWFVLASDKIDLGQLIHAPSYLGFVFFLSLMTVGVGFLSGKGGFWFGAGGFICYWILSPILAAKADPSVQALVSNPARIGEVLYKPTGIGMLIGAALGGIVVAFPLIRSAVVSMSKPRAESGRTVAQNDEMPIKLLAFAVLAGSVLLIAVAYQSTPDMTLGRATAMSILGVLWVWIAGVIVAECVGRTNWSPLSGMTLIAVTLLLVVGRSPDKSATIVSSLVVGGAICLAISQASDMMLDLKSGYLVGAVPRRQQLAQFIGAWLGPIVVVVLMFVINSTDAPPPSELPAEGDPVVAAAEQETRHEGIFVERGIGSERLPAPQAVALASVIEAIVENDVPTFRYMAAGVLGVLLAVSGLGGIGVMVALGFYMPFHIVLTYTLGCLLRVVANRTIGRRWCDEVGIPLAAGLIVGEALLDVGLSIYKIIP